MRSNRLSTQWKTATIAVAILISMPGCRVYQSINPHDPAQPGHVIRMERDGVVLSYRADIDRVIFFGQLGGPNMLHTLELDRSPAEDGSYTFYGGCYSWVAPQRGEMGWRDETGRLSDWPPDPAMDRGPMQVTRRTHNSLTARSPVMRNGLRKYVTFRFLGPGEIEVVRELENVSAEPRRGAIWTLTAVEPRAHIALRREAVETLWTQTEEEIEIVAPLLTPDAEYHLLDLRETHFENGVKVHFDADPLIAVHHSGWWFVRKGSWRSDDSLRDVGEAPMALYLNPGLEMFEAELRGPLRRIDPGERIVYSERWLLLSNPLPQALILP